MLLGPVGVWIDGIGLMNNCFGYTNNYIKGLRADLGKKRRRAWASSTVIYSKCVGYNFSTMIGDAK